MGSHKSFSHRLSKEPPQFVNSSSGMESKKELVPVNETRTLSTDHANVTSTQIIEAHAFGRIEKAKREKGSGAGSATSRKERRWCRHCIMNETTGTHYRVKYRALKFKHAGVLDELNERKLELAVNEQRVAFYRSEMLKAKTLAFEYARIIRNRWDTEDAVGLEEALVRGPEPQSDFNTDDEWELASVDSYFMGITTDDDVEHAAELRKLKKRRVE